MKAQRLLVSLFLLFCAGLPALGQEAGMSAPAYAVTNAAPAQPERQMLHEADQTRQKIAASLSDYLVLFNSRYDTENKRLGLPLTPFANSPFHLAYDPASRQMMAQWTFGSLGLMGNRVRYQAYMDGAGTMSFVLNARF